MPFSLFDSSRTVALYQEKERLKAAASGASPKPLPGSTVKEKEHRKPQPGPAQIANKHEEREESWSPVLPVAPGKTNIVAWTFNEDSVWSDDKPDPDIVAELHRQKEFWRKGAML